MNKESLPIISIIICTYNRAKYITTTLQHLTDQLIDKTQIEILIINNNSSDNTEELCLKYIKDHPQESIYYFVEEQQGLSYSRNRGIQEARGNLISFIDDDAFVAPDFSTNIISFFDAHPEVKVIGGKITPLYESKQPDWMSSYLLPLVSALDMGNSIKLFTGRKFPVGANMVFRKEVFQQYGNFNIALGRRGANLAGGEEKDLVMRLKADKALIYYVPNVRVGHVIPDKRLSTDYIKGLAKGVGQSEKERLKSEPLSKKILRSIEELIKIEGTFILCWIYVLRLQFPKASMLLKFRLWVLQGFLQK